MAGRENRSESPRDGVICSRGTEGRPDRRADCARLPRAPRRRLSLGATPEPTVTFEGVEDGYTSAHVKFTIGSSAYTTLYSVQYTTNLGTNVEECEWAWTAPAANWRRRRDIAVRKGPDGAGSYTVNELITTPQPGDQIPVPDLRPDVRRSIGEYEGEFCYPHFPETGPIFETKSVAKPEVDFDSISEITLDSAHFDGTVNANYPGGLGAEAEAAYEPIGNTPASRSVPTRRRRCRGQRPDHPGPGRRDPARSQHLLRSQPDGHQQGRVDHRRKILLDAGRTPCRRTRPAPPTARAATRSRGPSPPTTRRSPTATSSTGRPSPTSTKPPARRRRPVATRSSRSTFRGRKASSGSASGEPRPPSSTGASRPTISRRRWKRCRRSAPGGSAASAGRLLLLHEFRSRLRRPQPLREEPRPAQRLDRDDPAQNRPDRGKHRPADRRIPDRGRQQPAGPGRGPAQRPDGRQHLPLPARRDHWHRHRLQP